MVASNDDLVFLDDSEDDSEDVADLQPWRVLVVDDDQDVHEATRFGLAHLLILGRPLELLPTEGRPLSTDLPGLYRQREPLYRAAADFSVENTGLPKAAAEAAARGLDLR